MIKSKYIPELIMSVLQKEADSHYSLDAPSYVKLDRGRGYKENFEGDLTPDDTTAVTFTHLREVLNDIFGEENQNE